MQEIWKDIKGYEGLYQISNCGNLRSLSRKVRTKGNNYRRVKSALIKPGFRKNGYKYYDLYSNSKGKKFSAHRLVALAFIPNPNQLPQVNHKNRSQN